jgi:uncharacterized membrane protein
MTLFWVVVLGIIIWLIFQLIGRGRSPGSEAGRGRAEEILNERHARGEIDRETYSACWRISGADRRAMPRSTKGNTR